MPHWISAFLAVAPLLGEGFQSSDLYRLRSVGEVKISPDGARVAYTVTHNDKPGKPYSRLWVRDLTTGAEWRVAKNDAPSSGPEWSPDGRRLAWRGTIGNQTGLIVSDPDGSNGRFVHEMAGTNAPLLNTGRTVAWSPDGRHVAFVHAVPGPETDEASGDPVVITRYLYKPDADEGDTRFNDNRRLHIFVAELASGKVRQLTHGDYYEHSLDWSPDGREILFVSNREPDQDLFFNYDLFAVRVADGVERRITATENAEYRPRWSPDGRKIAYLGTRRGLTNLETTMEDTHVWVVDADGSNRRELGAVLDQRQMDAKWAPDGASVCTTAQVRGSVWLMRLPLTGGVVESLIAERGSVGDFTLQGETIAYAFTGPNDTAQMYWKRGRQPGQRLTDLNAEVRRGREVAEVESFSFVSNDFKWEIEAFLTRPLGLKPGAKHPLIVVIHGGPHAQQGPAFHFKNQVYAARGWATLMVNYRGSTGYGQRFADGVFGDQNGNEAQDVLYGVQAAMRRYLWIDRDRLGVEGGSYGGQLSAWLITQTHIFKAAVPFAAIINLTSYNYTTYYNMFEQMTFGIQPHQGTLMDTLWERSALKHVGKVRTPTLLLHGENDNDVPIGEAEQFYIALKDVGVDTVMVRYPREGHGLREVKHVVDSIDRSVRWYLAHFPADTPAR